jgi:hypothetical protein
MWQAIGNAIRLCAPDGLLFLSIYAGGDKYERHLALKRRFNAADDRTKAEMVRNVMQSTSSYYKPDGSSEVSTRHRGMTQYHDAIDWLGGLPYEVAHVSQVVLFGINRGLRPVRVFERSQGGCSAYLFRRNGMRFIASGKTFEWSSEWSEKKEDRELERQLSEDLKRACKLSQDQIVESKAIGHRNNSLANARRYLGMICRGLCSQG